MPGHFPVDLIAERLQTGILFSFSVSEVNVCEMIVSRLNCVLRDPHLRDSVKMGIMALHHAGQASGNQGCIEAVANRYGLSIADMREARAVWIDEIGGFDDEEVDGLCVDGGNADPDARCRP